MSFSRGEAVVWRSRPGGAVGYTLPATVVEASPEAIVLYQPAGTICKKRNGERGGPRGRNMIRSDGTHSDVVWHGPGTLRVHVPGTAHTVLRGWNANERCAEGWYVNLEDPWTRTRIGFDSFDHVLDVDVAPDLSSWTWKDEDELEWSIEHGKLTLDDADHIRAEGEHVIEAIERRAWPFRDDWSRWAPDPSRPIPVLRDGWDVP